ncbi:MAG: winged helix-turn-helix domain-containing protein [Candidatus Bathyarchaeia archaeon]
MTSDISERLQKIEQKLDALVKILEERLSATEDVSILPMKVEVPSKLPINVYLMKLPDSLRQTMFAMDKLREATTTQVAKETGRSRSVESIHLNQLERMGYLEKYRKGRKIYFRLPSPPKE